MLAKLNCSIIDWHHISESLPDLKTCTVSIIGLGYVGLPLAVEISKVKKSYLDKSQLKRFCGYSSRAEHVNTVYKLNRKYPLIHPGIKVTPTLKDDVEVQPLQSTTVTS